MSQTSGVSLSEGSKKAIMFKQKRRSKSKGRWTGSNNEDDEDYI